MSSETTKFEYPRSIMIDTYVRALNVLPVGGRDTRRNRVAIAARAEDEARARCTTYEAFEAEFLRLIEIETARQMIEEGVSSQVRNPNARSLYPLRSAGVVFPRATHEMFFRAMDLLGRDQDVALRLHNTQLVERVERAEREARMLAGHDTYEAFEAEFMRIVESEAARKIIEEGL